MRLELVVGHGPVLDRHMVRNGLGAVALDDVTAREMIARQVAPMLATPVIGSSADAVTRQERAEATHWKRRFRRTMAEGDGFQRRILDQLQPVGIAKFTRCVRSSPRSKPTTVSPALVSSRARMLPVQPMPTMTASTSFNRVAISLLPSREIRDRLRLDDVALVAILLDQVGIDRG